MRLCCPCSISAVTGHNCVLLMLVNCVCSSADVLPVSGLNTACKLRERCASICVLGLGQGSASVLRLSPILPNECSVGYKL
jgi:hypothetical protein